MSDVSRISSAGAQPRPFKTAGFFRRLTLWAGVLLGVALWNPNLFPGMVTPFLPVLEHLGGASYHIDSFEAKENFLVFSVTSRMLRDMRNGRGEPGPDIATTGSLPAFLLNVYPVLVFGILLALTRRAPGRRVLAALALAVLLTPLAAAADAWINIQVAAAKGLSQQWGPIAEFFPPTPENAEAFGRIQRSFDRCTLMKAALNAGGRLFVALLAGLLASLPLLLTGGRRHPETAGNPTPPPE